MIILIIIAIVFLIAGNSFVDVFVSLDSQSIIETMNKVNSPTVVYNTDDSDVVFMQGSFPAPVDYIFEFDTFNIILNDDLLDSTRIKSMDSYGNIERLNAILSNNKDSVIDFIKTSDDYSSSILDNFEVMTYNSPYMLDSINFIDNIFDIYYNLDGDMVHYTLEIFTDYGLITLVSVNPAISGNVVNSKLDEYCNEFNDFRIACDSITLDSFGDFSLDMFNGATVIKLWDNTEGITQLNIFGCEHSSYGIIVQYEFNGVPYNLYGVPIDGILVFSHLEY